MAQLALARATVEYEPTDGQSTAAGWADHAVIVRQNVLTISKDGVVARTEPATAVSRLTSRSYQVVTGTGVYNVTRAGGCGCGGKR